MSFGTTYTKREDLTPEEIVAYIKNNPGCIAELYDPPDRQRVCEFVLLNPKDWMDDYPEEPGTFENWSSRIRYADGFRAYSFLDEPGVIHFEET